MNDLSVTHAEPTPNDWFAKCERYVLDPWVALLAGYALMLLAIACSLSAAPALSIARQALAFIGAIIGGWAVWMRLRRPWQGQESNTPYLWAFLIPLALMAFVAVETVFGKSYEEVRSPLTILALIQVSACVAVGIVMRLMQIGSGNATTSAAAVLYVAAGVPLLGLFTQNQEWDSGILVFRVLTSLCLIGGLLAALPRLVRRVLVSAFFVYHFVGISMAATTLAIRGEQPGWLNIQLSQHIYKDYLNFMYLTNAYHYYSPDPGPPQLFYFCIEYPPTPGHPTGQHQWVSVPKREDFRTRLEYQRRLGVTESTNDVTGITPLPVQSFLVNYRKNQCNDPAVPGKRALDVENTEEALKLGISAATMIRKPSAYSQAMLRAYARYAANHYPLLDDNGDPVPGGKATSVKVYRVTHLILSPYRFAKGIDPLDKEQYLAVFQGEYDTEGNLLPNDGFVYTPLPNKWITENERDRYGVAKDWKLQPDEMKDVEDENGHVTHYILVNRMRMHADYFRRRPGP